MRRRNVVVGMLVGFAMMAQMVMPVMAKADNDKVDKDTYCVPKSETTLVVVPPPERLNLEPQAKVSEPEVALAGVYTAWNEVLPVGLAAQRSNILGTDRMVMAGKYIDCVVAIDLPEDQEIDALEVSVVAKSDSIQVETTTASGTTKATAEVQLADDVAALMPVSPQMWNGELRWNSFKWPCVVTESETIKLHRIGQRRNETGAIMGTTYTSIKVEDLQLGDSRHFEVVFRLYAMTEQDVESFETSGPDESDLSGGDDDTQHLGCNSDYDGNCVNTDSITPWEPEPTNP